MNRFVIGTIAAMLPFTASFAAGLNVNPHNIAATKVAALPALPRLQSAAPATMALPGLASMKLGALPGLSTETTASTCVAGRCPLNRDWFVYDQTEWKAQYRSWKAQETGIFLDGIGGMVGYVTRISCTDCGSPVEDVQGFFDTGLATLGSGLSLPAPRPHFPPGLAPFAALVFGAIEQVQAIVGQALGGGGST